MRPLLIFVLALAALLLPGRPAVAHTRSESFSSWQIDGARIRASFTVADNEAKRLTVDSSVPDNQTLIAYVTKTFGADVAGKACPVAAPAHMVAAKPGFRRIEFQFLCSGRDNITLRDDALFDRIPTHVNLAQIRTTGGDFAEQIFTADERTLNLSANKAHGLESAGFLRFIGMGIMHIFTGLDHQAFLLGLVLISRRLRDLVFVVTGFTLGHSLTLALAVTGIIRPHVEFIDALVALTIILIGVDNVTASTHKPMLTAAVSGGLLLLMWGLRLAGIGILPPALLFGAAIFSANYLMVSGTMRDAGRLRLIVTLVFGLIHGFGFAADLLESNIPTGRLVELLVGFNLGVEIAQLTLVAGVTFLVVGLGRLKLTLPRPIVVDACAALLVGVGMTWFVARSFA